MNRDKFCCLHWSYYLVLEKDFLDDSTGRMRQWIRKIYYVLEIPTLMDIIPKPEDVSQ